MLNVIILNWNSAEDTRKCVNSVIESDYKDLRIIIINNYYDEADLLSVKKIISRYGDKTEIILLENEKNLGYSGGNNTGIKYLMERNISGDILLLNPDITLSADTISGMLKFLDPETGIVTARTKDRHGKVLYDAMRLRGFFQRKIITDEKVIDTDYSQGSCMLIYRKIIDTMGIFDERFFLYWEEVDLSLRISQAGWKLKAVTGVSVTRSSNKDGRQPVVFYYSARNAMLIKEKHPQRFSSTGYFIYLVWLTIVSLKYILRPFLFVNILQNIYSGIADSFRNKYFEKAEL